jgi:hypothetical protein
MKAVIVLGLMLALGGCGAREELRPAAQKQLPVAPYAAKTPPSADALLQAPSQTRPARSDDLIESSQQRRSDEFDLPPSH